MVPVMLRSHSPNTLRAIAVRVALLGLALVLLAPAGFT